MKLSLPRSWHSPAMESLAAQVTKLTQRANQETKPTSKMNAREILERIQGVLVKQRTEGMAALLLREDGVGLIHLTFPGEGKGLPLLKTCVYRFLDKGQSPGKVVAGLLKEWKLEKARFAGVLNRGSYTLFPADVPDVPREEWASTMRWRIKDQIDFPAAQAVLEVFDMPGTFPGKESGRIYVVAAQDAEVRKQVRLFHEANLELLTIDIQELALRNLTMGLPDDQEGMALLHLEQKNGLIMMVKGGHFYLARQMDIGVDTLLDSLGDLGEDIHGNTLGIAHSPLMDNLALEAQRTMDYFESHFSQTPAVSLHIAPMATTIPGFRQALARKLGMRIKELPLEEVINIPDAINSMDLALCLPAIGTALRAGSTLST